MSDTARRWRLCGYDQEKSLVHDRVYVGDDLLDRALARLEADPEIVRTAVVPL